MMPLRAKRPRPAPVGGTGLRIRPGRGLRPLSHRGRRGAQAVLNRRSPSCRDISFDVRERGRRLRDTSGMDLDGVAQAIREATVIVEQMSAAARPGTVSVSVRDEGAACLYEASISFGGD